LLIAKPTKNKKGIFPESVYPDESSSTTNNPETTNNNQRVEAIPDRISRLPLAM
jgi:hypothetical protein